MSPAIEASRARRQAASGRWNEACRTVDVNRRTVARIAADYVGYLDAGQRPVMVEVELNLLRRALASLAESESAEAAAWAELDRLSEAHNRLVAAGASPALRVVTGPADERYLVEGVA